MIEIKTYFEDGIVYNDEKLFSFRFTQHSNGQEHHYNLTNCTELLPELANNPKEFENVFKEFNL